MSGLFEVTGGVKQIVFEKQVVTVIYILFILGITFICGCLSYILLNFHCKYFFFVMKYKIGKRLKISSHNNVILYMKS